MTTYLMATHVYLLSAIFFLLMGIRHCFNTPWPYTAGHFIVVYPYNFIPAAAYFYISYISLKYWLQVKDKEFEYSKCFKCKEPYRYHSLKEGYCSTCQIKTINLDLYYQEFNICLHISKENDLDAFLSKLFYAFKDKSIFTTTNQTKITYNLIGNTLIKGEILVVSDLEDPHKEELKVLLKEKQDFYEAKIFPIKHDNYIVYLLEGCSNLNLEVRFKYLTR